MPRLVRRRVASRMRDGAACERSIVGIERSIVTSATSTRRPRSTRSSLVAPRSVAASVSHAPRAACGAVASRARRVAPPPEPFAALPPIAVAVVATATNHHRGVYDVDREGRHSSGRLGYAETPSPGGSNSGAVARLRRSHNSRSVSACAVDRLRPSDVDATTRNGTGQPRPFSAIGWKGVAHARLVGFRSHARAPASLARDHTTLT